MSPFVSNNLIFSALILFIVVSIASNTLNYLSVQTNSDSLEQSQDVIEIIKNQSDNLNKLAIQNNEILKMLEDRIG
jgi:hypothetical protein